MGVSPVTRRSFSALILPPLGDNGQHDFVAILEDHLTPARMFSKSKVYRGGKSLIASDKPLDRVRVIGCGSYHSLIVTGGLVSCMTLFVFAATSCSHLSHCREDGGLYSCGLNNYGQLGTGDTDSQQLLTKVLRCDRLGSLDSA